MWTKVLQEYYFFMKLGPRHKKKKKRALIGLHNARAAMGREPGDREKGIGSDRMKKAALAALT